MGSPPESPPGGGGVEDAFRAALSADAAAAPPAIGPPPRVTSSSDLEAPHGRAEDGTPLAPYGHTASGRPRIKPAGPGRGHKNEPPRLQDAPAAPTTPGAAGAPGPDYRENLAGLGVTAWAAGAMWGPSRPYAHALKQQLPGLVESWNLAAQNNATVRGYVEKLAGEGSWAWVIGVSVASGQLVAAWFELSKNTPEAKDLRARAGAACELEFRQYVTAQLAESGLELVPTQQPEAA